MAVLRTHRHQGRGELQLAVPPALRLDYCVEIKDAIDGY